MILIDEIDYFSMKLFGELKEEFTYDEMQKIKEQIKIGFQVPDDEIWKKVIEARKGKEINEKP